MPFFLKITVITIILCFLVQFKMYDENNIFFKMITGEICVEKIYETQYSFAIFDKYPKCKIHLLVIPKGKYISFDDFQKFSTQEEKLDFWNCVEKVIDKFGLKDGFKLITNSGENGCQEIFHFHFHLLGGEKIKSFF